MGMRRRPGPSMLVATMLLVTAVLSGCSDPAIETAPPRSSQPASSAPATTALFGISSETLGWVVIDVQGYVLYRFDGDSARPSRATCVDTCATQWLPVPGVDTIRVEGIDRQLVGTVLRPDGKRQLTLAGWPLYGYVGDRMPGDTNGHGVDGKWFTITPVGTKAGPTPSAP